MGLSLCGLGKIYAVVLPDSGFSGPRRKLHYSTIVFCSWLAIYAFRLAAILQKTFLNNLNNVFARNSLFSLSCVYQRLHWVN